MVPSDQIRDIEERSRTSEVHLGAGTDDFGPKKERQVIENIYDLSDLIRRCPIERWPDQLLPGADF